MSANAPVSVHALGILNHAMGEHRSSRDLVTPSSLLLVITSWYLMPALLHSPDERVKRRQRFTSVESGDTLLPLSRLMAYPRRGDSKQRDAAYKYFGGGQAR